MKTRKKIILAVMVIVLLVIITVAAMTALQDTREYRALERDREIACNITAALSEVEPDCDAD